MSQNIPNSSSFPTRRNVIAKLPAAGLAAGGIGGLLGLITRATAGELQDQDGMPNKLATVFGAIHDGTSYALPPLPYAYDALAPTIDRMTMELHHDKHHQGYVTGLNKAVEALGNTTDPTAMGGLMRNLSFNYGGHVLHSLFWAVMGPNEQGKMGGEPTGELAEAIKKDFGGFDAFKQLWSDTAGTVKGSGWVTLVYDHVAARMFITSIGDHDRYVMASTVPLMPLDIWEHAYYLTYQNRRGDYVKAFLDVVDWNVVATLHGFSKAMHSEG